MKTLLGSVFILIAPFTILYAAQHVDLGTIGDDVKVTVLEADNSRTVVRFDIGGFTKIPVRIGTETYFNIDLPGESVSLNEGEPALPRVCRSIIIPDGAKVNIRVLESEYIEFKSTPVAPSKGNLYRDINPDDIAFTFGPLYESNQWNPSELAALRDPYILRDFRGTVIELYAFQYNHALKTLRVYNSVTVEVYNDGPGSVNILSREEPFAKTTSDFNMIYERRFINYNKGLLLYAPVMEAGDLLVITHDAFRSAMLPFVNWKNQKGIKTTIVDISTIGNSVNLIDNFIQAFYDSTNLAYVLLVGDGAQVASPYASGGSSDPSYAKVAGNDNYPDIFIGRFSAENISQVETQVNRTINYERFPQSGIWHNQAVGIASDQGPGHHGEYDYQHMGYIRNDLLSYNYSLVDEIYDPGANASQVSLAVNNGRGIINYCGHGSRTSWVTSGFSNSNVNSLSNTGFLPLLISVACVNGEFDGYTCFAEAWLRATYNNEPAGAIAAYMSSINQSWNPPMDAQDECNDLLVAETKTTVGGICFNGSCFMIDLNGAAGVEMYDTWHIFGDPSLQIFTTDPVSMSVNHSNAVVFTISQFNVIAGAGGALCALYHNGVSYGSAYADSSGNATIDIAGQLPVGETVTLTVTAFNKLPYEAPIQVIAPSGPYVVFDSCAVNDAAGNNNGLIDFGENILLDMQLENVGPDTAFNVIAVLSTSDQYVTITDTVEAYGIIAGDFGRVSIAGAFEFQVFADAPDQHLIPFQVQIVAGLENWTSNFSLSVHAPDLQFAAYVINDASGNGNGILEAGETAELIMTVLNGGTGEAADVAGTISENDDFVSISDNSGVFGDLAPGGSGDNSSDVFIIAADSLFPQGHSVVFDLDLTAVGGYSLSTQFILTTAESFEYNNGGYAGSGNWQWGEPTYGPPGAYFGVNVWGVNLSGDYPLNCNDNLISTPFQVHSPEARFTFYHWYNVEQNWDGGNVSISTDGGSNWELITPLNGYPHQDVSALNEPGFTGSISGWEQVEFNLSEYVGDAILIRWRFASDSYINGPGWYIDDVALINNIPQAPPNMSYNPASFNVSASPGEVATRELEITNNGAGPLYFDLYAATNEPEITSLHDADPIENNVRSRSPIGFHPAANKRGSKAEPIYPPVILDHGGPDAFGYEWIDSNDPGGPAYNWVDITGIGTPITGIGDDTNVGPFPIGFGFEFYGNIFNSIRFCTNGFLSFTSTATAYLNQSIPDSDGPYNLIAPMWDDLSFSSSGSAYYYSNNADTAIYSWVAVPHYGTGGPYTFQIILLSNNKIYIQYQDINSPDNSSTVGIQNDDGSIGLEIAFDAQYLTDNLAIEISAPTNWLSASPVSGIVQPNESINATITFDSSDLPEGIYTGNLYLDSNDPVSPSVDIAVTFNVSTLSGCDYIAGDINNSGDLNGLDVTFAVAYFKGGPASGYECECTPGNTWFVSGDVNNSCFFNGLDVTYMVAYFKGGPAPVPCQDCPPVSTTSIGKNHEKGINSFDSSINRLNNRGKSSKTK